MPVTVGPDEHLAVTLALASAAPVAAKPLMLGLVELPPQAASKAAAVTAANGNLVCLIESCSWIIEKDVLNTRQSVSLPITVGSLECFAARFQRPMLATTAKKTVPQPGINSTHPDD